jgi:hypothetical protein
MSLIPTLKRWSKAHTVYIAGNMDKYNQCTYTQTSISGRLIQTEEEITTYNNNLQDRNMGDKVIAKAKFFTTSNEITINSKVGQYKVISKKPCTNKNSVIEFYKYYLK